MQKNEMDPCFTQYIKSSCKWTEEINIRAKTIKTL